MKLTESVIAGGSTNALQGRLMPAASARVITRAPHAATGARADLLKPDTRVTGNRHRTPLFYNFITSRIDNTDQLRRDVDGHASVTGNTDRVFADSLDSPPQRPPG